VLFTRNEDVSRLMILVSLVVSLMSLQATAQESEEAPKPIPSVRMVDAFPKVEFDRPVFMTYAPNDPTRYYVVEQKGVIRVFDIKDNKPDATSSTVFLDISPKTFSYNSEGHNEEGLLALAFHPKFAENGYFFVYYSAARPHRGVLSRFKVGADNPLRADPKSETVFLEVLQPYGNHNGCTVLFGPDHYLYASFGDGGSGRDCTRISGLLGGGAWAPGHDEEARRGPIAANGLARPTLLPSLPCASSIRTAMDSIGPAQPVTLRRPNWCGTVITFWFAPTMTSPGKTLPAAGEFLKTYFTVK